MYFEKVNITAKDQALVCEVPTRGGAATVLITGTFTAVLQFEASVDGTTYSSVAAYPVAGGASVTATTNTAGCWQIKAGGFRFVQVRCSAYTSGTAATTINATEGVFG